MPIDPNIALQVQQPQFQNPLDTAVKAMTLKDLSQRGEAQGLQLQQAKLEANDQQAVRDAYKHNTINGPDGMPVVNRQGLLSDLAQQSPQAAMHLNQQFQSADLDAMKKRQETTKDLLFGISDQASYSNALEQAKKLGIPGASNLPSQYDPNLVRRMQMANLTAEEQIAQQNKQRDLDLKTQEVGAKIDANKVAREQMGNKQQAGAVDSVTKMLESARGNPAASQAEKDLYAAQKFSSLFNLYGDPNKLNPQQVQLGASEVAKISTGGVPASHELQGLNPNAIPKRLAELAQVVSNNPQGAQAGEFMKAMKDYTDSLASDAKKVIEDKYGRVLETNRGRLGEENYNKFKDQYINRFTPKSDDSADTVVIQTPDGKTGTIPKANLDKALSLGAKKVSQ